MRTLSSFLASTGGSWLQACVLDHAYDVLCLPLMQVAASFVPAAVSLALATDWGHNSGFECGL
jgi:hypothetical protein